MIKFSSNNYENIKSNSKEKIMLNSLWPIPNYKNNNEPHFLFIITPPYSGSTALAKFLNTSKQISLFGLKGEGQWLIPGLCEKNRWEKDKYINYSSVKAVWLNDNGLKN